jgi:hypothetical protein
MAEAGEQEEVMAAQRTGRRDPYEVLEVPRDATEQQIKNAYRKLALKYHPDKNTARPDAAEKFKEVAYSYSILCDPEKRERYDAAGFEAVDLEGVDMELDLSNLGTINTVFAALFSKLGVPIKTTISAGVLKDALSGTVTIRPLPLSRPMTEKLLYFEQEENGGLGLAQQEDSVKAGRITSAAMYFLHFQVCRLDPTVNAVKSHS